MWIALQYEPYNTRIYSKNNNLLKTKRILKPSISWIGPSLCI